MRASPHSPPRPIGGSARPCVVRSAAVAGWGPRARQQACPRPPSKRRPSRFQPGAVAVCVVELSVVRVCLCLAWQCAPLRLCSPCDPAPPCACCPISPRRAFNQATIPICAFNRQALPQTEREPPDQTRALSNQPRALPNRPGRPRTALCGARVRRLLALGQGAGVPPSPPRSERSEPPLRTNNRSQLYGDGPPERAESYRTFLQSI